MRHSTLEGLSAKAGGEGGRQGGRLRHPHHPCTHILHRILAPSPLPPASSHYLGAGSCPAAVHCPPVPAAATAPAPRAPPGVSAPAHRTAVPAATAHPGTRPWSLRGQEKGRGGGGRGVSASAQDSSTSCDCSPRNASLEPERTGEGEGGWGQGGQRQRTGQQHQLRLLTQERVLGACGSGSDQPGTKDEESCLSVPSAMLVLTHTPPHTPAHLSSVP